MAGAAHACESAGALGAAAAAVPRRRWRPSWLLALAGAVVLAGCGSDRPPPAPLENIQPQIAGRQVWQQQIGGARLALTVPVQGQAFIVAGDDGRVAALDAESGRTQWRGSFDAGLSAGVGSDGRYAAAVTRDNELRVLDRGRLLWRAPLASAVSTAPLVAGERVFVLGVDRQVQAYDALDGRLLWRWQRPGGEALTLAQRGVLQAWQDTLLVGQGAVLVGLDPTRGGTRFEVALSPTRGTNEVERLNDLVGPALRSGDRLCARAFQTAVACVDLGRRSLLWNRVTAGVQALGGDAQALYGADASDRLSAWKAADGELLWRNERFLNRGLSAPLAVGRVLVVGDSQGYVHFLSRSDGSTLLRLSTDGSPIVTQPVLAGNTVLVVTRDGGLHAFRPD